MTDTLAGTRPAYRIKKKQPGINTNKLNNTHQLREKLLMEMVSLDKQRQQLEIGASEVDFARAQTFREMILSRRALLDQLNRTLK